MILKKYEIARSFITNSWFDDDWLHTVENLNCLFHPEMTDLDYILQKAKNLGKYHEKKKCVTEYEFKSMSLFLYT